MTFRLGNKLTGAFTGTASEITFAITGFSWSGGDRPEIDITTGGDDRRKVLAGLASPEEYTLSIKYNGEDLTGEMEDCSVGSLTVSLAPDDNCGTATAVLSAVPVDIVSWNHSVELDGILEGEVTFRRRHS
ncbi:MAG: hypothetical protein GY876_05205 [Planctomycetes bacterium]|nr:hypothetical protein [Planctomycetota bacterium]